MTPHAIRILTAALAVVACLTFSPNAARAEWQLATSISTTTTTRQITQRYYIDNENLNVRIVYVWKDGTRATVEYSDNPGPDDPVPGKGDLNSRIDLAKQGGGGKWIPEREFWDSPLGQKLGRGGKGPETVHNPGDDDVGSGAPAIRASTRKSSADRCSSTRPAISAPAKAAAFKSTPDRPASRSRNPVVPAGTRATTAMTMTTKAVRLPIRATDRPNWSIRSGRSSSRSRQQAATTGAIATRKKCPASHCRRKRLSCNGPLSANLPATNRKAWKNLRPLGSSEFHHQWRNLRPDRRDTHDRAHPLDVRPLCRIDARPITCTIHL